MTQTYARRAQGGFTLIELLVVCAIMIVVSGVILANNSKFGGEVELQNLAYDIALSVRQAQVYGISVERFGTGSGSTFSSGFGMYFSASTPQQYILFADAAFNGTYEAGDLVQSSSIGQNYYISGLCAVPSLGGACASVSKLVILFIRPEPDAWINPTGCTDSSGVEECSGSDASAEITVESPRDETMTITVSANGQISVGQTITQ